MAMQRQSVAAEVVGQAKLDEYPKGAAGERLTPIGVCRFLSVRVGSDGLPNEAGSLCPGSRLSAGSLDSSSSPNVSVFSCVTSELIRGLISYVCAFARLRQ